ncbi:MAG: apolipoprotein N-acyltransferase [Polyangiaceae bacterium]|nr:apolipoprotein N-acyltransferase [Polyangiaceae bacterium]
MKRERLFGWTCAVLAALVQAHAAMSWGHLMWLAPVLWGLAAMVASRSPAPRRLALAMGAVQGVVASAHLWGVYFYAPSVYAVVIGYHLVLWAAFTLLAAWVLARAPRVAPLALGAAWAFLESVRGLGALSFPFYFGGMLAEATWIAQAASVVGASGLSGLVFAAGFAVAGLVADRLGEPRWGARAAWAPPLALVALTALGGGLRLALAPASTPTLRVVALQGAVPQWLYSLGTGTGPFRRVIEEHYGALYRRALAGPVKPDLVLFPETAFDWHVQATTEGIRRIGPLGATRLPARTSVVVGASFAGRHQADSQNGVAFLQPGEGGLPVLTEATSKRRLVPFIEAGHRPGARWATGRAAGRQLFVLICYESMYAEAAVAAREEGAELLAVLSDDAGMRWSPMAWTHAEQAKLRAIEAGLPLVRAGQFGPSYAVDAYGRVLATLGHGATGLVAADLPAARPPTLYSRIGRWWVIVWAGLFLAGVLAPVRVRAGGAR